MKNNPFQISRRDIIKYTSLGFLATIVTQETTQNALENQVEPIQEPSTEDEFPFTLAGMFLDSIQEVINKIKTEPNTTLGSSFSPFLQNLYDSYANTLETLPENYKNNIQATTDFKTQLHQSRSFFDQITNVLHTNPTFRNQFTSISSAIQILRHRDLINHNPFQIPKELHIPYLYATAFEFNNIMYHDMLAAIYTEGLYKPKSQEHLTQEIFQESLLTHLAHNYPQPNSLWRQVDHESSLATEYFRGKLTNTSQLQEIANTNIFISKSFIQAAHSKQTPDPSVKIKPILRRSY
jgi:hypothetical protein